MSTAIITDYCPHCLTSGIVYSNNGSPMPCPHCPHGERRTIIDRQLPRGNWHHVHELVKPGVLHVIRVQRTIAREWRCGLGYRPPVERYDPTGYYQRLRSHAALGMCGFGL